MPIFFALIFLGTVLLNNAIDSNARTNASIRKFSLIIERKKTKYGNQLNFYLLIFQFKLTNFVTAAQKK